MHVSAAKLNTATAAAAPDAVGIIDAYDRGRLWLLAQIAAVMGIVLTASWYVGLLNVSRLIEGIPAILTLLADSFPPDFTNFLDWLEPLAATLAMSIAGTALAIVFSLPLGFLAARNTTPSGIAYHLFRTILNGLRAIPELIMGIIFVAAVGFGALPGVLALGLHSIGMVGKFFAESIEHVDPAPIEAARAAGATPMQTIVHAYLPQVVSQFADVSVYRWEYNFRASTVLGMVGAGGIGFELMASLRLLQYQQVMAILLVILVMVTMVDGLGSRLRKRLR